MRFRALPGPLKRMRNGGMIPEVYWVGGRDERELGKESEKARARATPNLNKLCVGNMADQLKLGTHCGRDLA